MSCSISWKDSLYPSSQLGPFIAVWQREPVLYEQPVTSHWQAKPSHMVLLAYIQTVKTTEFLGETDLRKASRSSSKFQIVRSWHLFTLQNFVSNLNMLSSRHIGTFQKQVGAKQEPPSSTKALPLATANAWSRSLPFVSSSATSSKSPRSRRSWTKRSPCVAKAWLVEERVKTWGRNLSWVHLGNQKVGVMMCYVWNDNGEGYLL